MAASHLLLTLLDIKQRLARTNGELVKYQNIKSKASKAVARMEQTRAKYDDAYSKALDPKSDIKLNGKVFVSAGTYNENLAHAYAAAVADMTDYEIDCAMFDINDWESEIETKCVTLEAQKTEDDAFSKNVETQLAEELKNTHTITGG